MYVDFDKIDNTSRRNAITIETVALNIIHCHSVNRFILNTNVNLITNLFSANDKSLIMIDNRSIAMKKWMRAEWSVINCFNIS